MNDAKYESNIYNKLIKYSKSDIYPFHMPGHKRNTIGENPFSYDITEVDGFDNLHDAQGILKESMDRAARFYGSKATYFLVNGSSCGILSSIAAVTWKENNKKIIIARNSHKSVYNAVFMGGLEPIYLYPDVDTKTGINLAIDAEAVDNLISKNTDVTAIVITSPTYEGVVSDIAKIAEIVHKWGKILIVDEAHGAHFSRNSYFPASAIDCGADIVIQSVHKTLPSLTQTALLHVNSDKVSISDISKFLGIYESSSPSYVLMSSIDNCIKRMIDEGSRMFDNEVNMISNFREETASLINLHLFNIDNQKDKANIGKINTDTGKINTDTGKSKVFDYDKSKLVIYSDVDGFTGSDLYKVLLERFHLQMEMSAGRYVIAMTSCMDTQEGFDRLSDALEIIDKELLLNKKQEKLIICEDSFIKESHCTDRIENEVKLTVSEAYKSEKMIVNIENSIGNISAEYIFLYPPGIPLLVPGEVISQCFIEQLIEYKRMGLNISGMSDKSLETICVIKD